MRTDTIIIGGGQAGLAMSRCLLDRGIDHVVLERGRVAERWRSERWDSLRLLTPRWQSRLPGWRYRGVDPHGYMSMPELIEYLEGYAGSFAAPVQTGTTVRAVAPDPGGYCVSTDAGILRAPNVVIATGACDRPAIPAMAARLPGTIYQTAPTRYRSPRDLPPGGVLVIGASASGLQLADELQAAGRAVTLAVGSHTRLPRQYLGRDIMWWLDGAGMLDRRTDEVRDLAAARTEPSLQLVGRPDHRSLDLGVLLARGVRLTGRLVGVDGDLVSFADDLDDNLRTADARLARLLDRIDAFAAEHGLAGPGERPRPIGPIRAPAGFGLRAAGIGTVIWATGFRRHYPWLRVPVLDRRGELRHDGGITPAPGLYALGLPFQRRRKSTFIDGVGDDAAALADDIAARVTRAAA
jgi:putative flavoprotein involved in K+ transport